MYQKYFDFKDESEETEKKEKKEEEKKSEENESISSLADSPLPRKPSRLRTLSFSLNFHISYFLFFRRNLFKICYTSGSYIM